MNICDYYGIINNNNNDDDDDNDVTYVAQIHTSHKCATLCDCGMLFIH